MIPLLSLLPPPGKKKKAPTPQGGAADSRGELEGARRTIEGGGSQIPGRAGQGGLQRGEGGGSGRSCPLPPCPLSRGLNTTKGTGVCGFRSDREKRSRRNEWLNLVNSPKKTSLPPFLQEAPWVVGEAVRSWWEERRGKGYQGTLLHSPLSPSPTRSSPGLGGKWLRAHRHSLGPREGAHSCGRGCH